MKKYPITIDGKNYNVSYIGVNHLASGEYINGNASSYNKDFEMDDVVFISGDLGDLKYCKIGNIMESYHVLKEELNNMEPRDIYEYSYCVGNAILNYFGNFSNVKNRKLYLPSDDDKQVGLVSNLAYKNAATSIERAMLAQNFLIDVGLKSIYKVSGAIINGEECVHAYNLISHNGKCYIFDATIPTLREIKTNPIICEIPKDVFDKLSSPNPKDGCSVLINHYNPFEEKDYEIVYDAGREETYTIEKSIKTKVKK